MGRIKACKGASSGAGPFEHALLNETSSLEHTRDGDIPVDDTNASADGPTAEASMQTAARLDKKHSAHQSRRPSSFYNPSPLKQRLDLLMQDKGKVIGHNRLPKAL